MGRGLEVSRVLTEAQLSTLLGVILTFQAVPFEKRKLRQLDHELMDALGERLRAVRGPIYGGSAPGVATTLFNREELVLLVATTTDCVAAFQNDPVGVHLFLRAERIEDVQALLAIVSDALAEVVSAAYDFA